jgi:hypothetical protein
LNVWLLCCAHFAYTAIDKKHIHGTEDFKMIAGIALDDALTIPALYKFLQCSTVHLKKSPKNLHKMKNFPILNMQQIIFLRRYFCFIFCCQIFENYTCVSVRFALNSEKLIKIYS